MLFTSAPNTSGEFEEKKQLGFGLKGHVRLPGWSVHLLDEYKNQRYVILLHHDVSTNTHMNHTFTHIVAGLCCMHLFAHAPFVSQRICSCGHRIVDWSLLKAEKLQVLGLWPVAKHAGHNVIIRTTCYILLYCNVP